MVSIHAECLLYDLRMWLSAVRDHNERLCQSPEMFHVERGLAAMIEKVEDAQAFIQALEELGSQAEARMGSGQRRDDV